jgi:hypothetical protein
MLKQLLSVLLFFFVVNCPRGTNHQLTNRITVDIYREKVTATNKSLIISCPRVQVRSTPVPGAMFKITMKTCTFTFC